MSLIADALKAAQKERDRSRGAQEHRAKRVLEGGAGQRTLAVRAGSLSMRVTRPVAIALALFVVALGTLVWVFFSAPQPATAGPGVEPRTVASVGEAEGGPGSPAVAAPDSGASEEQRLASVDGDPRAAGSENEGRAGGGTPPAPGDEGTAATDRSAAGPEADAASPDAAGAEVPMGDPSEAQADSRARAATPPDAADPPERVADRARPGAATPDGSGAEAGEAVAEPSFQLSVEAPVRAPELFALALAAQRRGDHQRALALYQDAAAREPGNARLQNNLGTVYRSLGRLEEARDAYRRALAIDDAFAAAWNNLGVVYESMDQPGEAVAAYERALRLEPDNRSAKVNLANRLRASGQLNEALALLQEVLVGHPTSAEAHYAIARVYEARRDRTAAARHYRSFLEHGAGQFPDLEAAVRRHLITLEG